MNGIYNADGRAVMLAMIKAIQENGQYLGDIVGLIGDGDHGANMSKGFGIYKERLGDGMVSLPDGLYELGSVLMNRIGGSMGPLYGSMFMAMSDEAADKELIDAEVFSAMLRAGLDGIYELVEARPGDKTIVDTLYPAVCAAEKAQSGGESFFDLLEAVKDAASAGAQSTKEMTAKYGRASRLGERSRGVLDAGAVSCSIIICAMADAMQKLLGKQGGC